MNSYNPENVVNAVFSWEAGSIGTCQYPDAKSRVVKYRDRREGLVCHQCEEGGIRPASSHSPSYSRRRISIPHPFFRQIINPLLFPGG